MKRKILMKPKKEISDYPPPPHPPLPRIIAEDKDSLVGAILAERRERAKQSGEPIPPSIRIVTEDKPGYRDIDGQLHGADDTLYPIFVMIGLIALVVAIVININ